MAKKKKEDQAPNDEALQEYDDRMSKYGVKTESKKVKKREALIRILVIILVILLLFLSIMFACSSYINKAGDFTVTMDKDAFNMGITLSETPGFENATRFLAGEKCADMKECTYSWLPEDIDAIDGTHNRSNGSDFLAYTFYVKNAGKVDVGYTAHIDIESAALGTDDAMRVMVFRNGKPTIYAKPVKGTTNMIEPNNDTRGVSQYQVDKNFVTNTRIMEMEEKFFPVGTIDKYTVVIWLEGWDPECVDAILDGEVKMSMKFDAYELDGSDGSAS